MEGELSPPNPRRRRFGLAGLSIRAKLLAATLTLALIPFVGFGYVREMESFLRAGQEQAIVATARAAALALHDRPQLLEFRSGAAEAPRGGPRSGSINETALQRPDDEATSVERRRALLAGERGAAIAEIEQIIRALGRAQSRIWVLDQRRELLVLTGSLRPRSTDSEPPEEDGFWNRWIRPVLIRPIASLLLAPPAEDFDDALPESAVSGGKEVDSALSGIPASRRRPTTDNRAVVVSAAHPIWSGAEVIGAVVVEETTNPIVSVRYRAFEHLLGATLAVFVLGAGALFVFASRLSARLRRLRDEAEGAIDAQGRVRQLVQASNSADELGDLSRSFSTMLAKLAQYNTYLERMADRLSHELRTPVAVVSSSLDNLRAQTLPADAEPYVARAEAGLKRLNLILTRMREATRLERLLQEVERERFDLCKVIAGCAGAYGGAFPDHRFDLALPAMPVWLNGSPELIAQMLDKIVDNAVDFSPRGEPIEVSLTLRDGYAILGVANIGPALPATMQGQLFESMISVRGTNEAGPGARDDRAPHLGLGLFMVRLIAEFHAAQASARNRPDGRGVIVEVAFVPSA